MVIDSWTIYWSEYTSDTYLYGTDLIFHEKNDVEFTNILMPPSTVIKEWYSRTNFQAQMIEPTLPIIDGEGAYRLTVNMDIDENEQFLGKLVFYDKYDNEVGIMLLRDIQTEFKCPISTYSYRFQLINGGITHFRFHSLMIQEITADEYESSEEYETTDTGSDLDKKRRAIKEEKEQKRMARKEARIEKKLQKKDKKVKKEPHE